MVDTNAAAWADALARGQAAWPALVVDAATFTAHVAAVLEPERDPATQLPDLHAGDLYLAAAVRAGHPGADAAVAALVHAVVAESARTVRGADAVTGELTSRVLVRVLGPRDGAAEPALQRYGGRAPLRAWLRVMVVRDAVKLVSARQREPSGGDDALVAALSPDLGPELAYMGALYRQHAREAFAAALAGLVAKDRLLLAQAVVDDLSIDELAPLHGVGRSTVARWLVAARERLADATRAELARRLGVDATEIDSILRLVRSQLDVSLAGLAPFASA